MARAIALVVAVLGLSGVVAADPAAASTAGEPVELALAAQPFVVAAGGKWTATFSVTGDLGAATPPTAPPTTTPPTAPGAAPTTTTRVPPAPTVGARVLVRRRVADPTDLARTVGGRLSPIISRLTVPVTLKSDGDQTTFTVTVPTAADPGVSGALLLDRAGVYPLTVQLVIGGQPVGGSDTFLDRLPFSSRSDVAPFNIAVVAAVGEPGPAPSSTQLAAGGDELQAIAQTAAALGGQMTLQAPPAVLDHLRADDPDLLSRVQSSLGTSEVLAQPAPPLDPSSAAAAGLQARFAHSLGTGEDVLDRALPAAPPERSAWMARTALSAGGAAMLRDPLGFDLLVFDRAVYDTLDGGIGAFHDTSQSFDVDLGGGAKLPGFVVSESSHWLDRNDLDQHHLSPADGAVRLMSELVVARDTYGADRRRSAVLALPAGVAPDPEVAAILSSYVSSTPGFRLATLSALPSSTDPMMVPDRGVETVRLPATAGPDLTTRVERINLTRVAAAAASSLLSDGGQLDRWNGSLDALLSTAVTEPSANAELDRISGEMRSLYDQIVLPRPFTLTLTGRRSTLRINLRNTGPHELHVVVRPTSPKLRFPEGDESAVLAPGSTTEVEIPVQAQTNGTSAISIELVSPFGHVTVQGPVVLTARVNALSGLGQLVTGGALLVLVSWWYGHFRRRRRERRAMLGEVDNPAPVEAATVSPDAAESVAAPPAPNGDTPAPETPAEPPVAPAEDVAPTDDAARPAAAAPADSVSDP